MFVSCNDIQMIFNTRRICSIRRQCLTVRFYVSICVLTRFLQKLFNVFLKKRLSLESRYLEHVNGIHHFKKAVKSNFSDDIQ